VSLGTIVSAFFILTANAWDFTRTPGPSGSAPAGETCGVPEFGHTF
jgi:cytochrome bd-type quinol oxidase subunit 1